MEKEYIVSINKSLANMTQEEREAVIHELYEKELKPDLLKELVFPPIKVDMHI